VASSSCHGCSSLPLLTYAKLGTKCSAAVESPLTKELAFKEEERAIMEAEGAAPCVSKSLYKLKFVDRLDVLTPSEAGNLTLSFFYAHGSRKVTWQIVSHNFLVLAGVT
jgi:hypothetical protein